LAGPRAARDHVQIWHDHALKQMLGEDYKKLIKSDIDRADFAILLISQIMGAPGVGKSAFAAQLTYTRGDTIIAAQICEWGKPDHRNSPQTRGLAPPDLTHFMGDRR
jgi:hypothetical protein